MPFLYVYVCDLLEDLGHLVYRPCPMLVGLEKETNKRTVNWLQRHKNKLNEFSVDAQAVLMFFTPHKQTDREYGLDAERLEQLIARVLNLSSDQRAELQLWWKGPVHGDLAACVQQVMEKMTGLVATRSITDRVTVEDIDQALLKIASHNPNSSPEVRSLASSVKTYDAIELLGKIYRSLGAKEAKWLTRLILKDYGPIKFPERLDCSSGMQFLPNCVRVSAEINISDAFPALRKGTGTITGSKPVGSKLFHRGCNTPKTTSPKRIRGFATASGSVNQLPTPPTTRTHPSVPVVTRRSPISKVPFNPMPTPPTTAPDRSSSAATPTHILNASVQLQLREPLAPLDLNSQASQHSSEPKANEPSPSMLSLSIHQDTLLAQAVREGPSSSHRGAVRQIHNTTSQRHQVPPTASLSEKLSPERSPAMIINGTGTCVLTTKPCPLINCIFLLAPCISSIPYINQNLLSWHGSRTVTSLHSFADPSLPRRCPRTGHKYRKIALVEPNRIEQTQEFMNRIGRLNLRRRSGKKQWVEVYDWRILEYTAKEDRGHEKGYNPWRRCWMGAV